MQKIQKAFVSLIIVALIFNVLPFKLLASSNYQIVPTSYYEFDSTKPTAYYQSQGSDQVRAVCLYNGILYRVYYVANTSNSNNRINETYIRTTQYVNLTTSSSSYMLGYSAGGSGTFQKMFADVFGFQRVNSFNDSDAIYYTFGEGNGDGPSYGDLLNIGFYTKFVNSQQSNISQMALNKDVITWDNYQDSNGNPLNDINLRVDIQAATIDYEATTKSDLLNQVLNNMVTGSWSDLVSMSPNTGSFEITWDQVARQLWGTDNVTVNFWNNLFNVYDSARGVFFKNGWIYRVRLRTVDNSYVGQWQTVYNVTSMPPADSEKVYNNYYVYNYTVPNEDTYQVIQTINNYNNTENNWYQNDVPFSPDGGSDWLEKLLEFISELINHILDFFSSIFDGLVDLILGLFDNINPAESFFNWFSDLFNGIGDIDLTLPQFNIPSDDLSSFNRLVQETMDIFSLNNFGFVIFIPLLLIIIKAVF